MATDTRSNGGKSGQEGAWPPRAGEERRGPGAAAELGLLARPAEGTRGHLRRVPGTARRAASEAGTGRSLSPHALSRSLAPRPNMAGGRCGPRLTALLAAWVAALAAAAADEADLEHAPLPAEQSMVLPMTASNWTLVMEGEWMLKL